MDFFDLLTMMGGLALFLYGMHMMGEGRSRVSWQQAGEYTGKTYQQSG